MKVHRWFFLGFSLVFSSVWAQGPEFTYKMDKRDPFKPFLQKEEPIRPKGVPETPLLRFDLSQLRLVAIVVGVEGNRAMVEDSEGKGYIIKEGDYVGRRYGQVKKITVDKVIIEETYRDALGRIQKRQVFLSTQPMEVVKSESTEGEQ